MRLMNRGSESFVGRVVKETRALVNSSHHVHTKVALLESAIADELEHIGILQSQLPGATPNRQARLLKILDLRKRALAHYRCTVKALLLRDQRSLALRRLPSFLAGGPPTSTRAREAPQPGDYPFMEFSS